LLQNAIDECVRDEDYLNARHNYLARNKLSRELDTLYKLRDPLHFEKEQALRILDMYKSSPFLMDTDDGGFYQQYLQKSIKEQRALLHKLNQQKYEYYDGQEIDNALFDLYDGKTSGFKLYLNQQQKIYFEFRRNTRRNLLISIDMETVIEKISAFNDPLLFFKVEGFKVDEVSNKLYYLYVEPFKDAIAIKALLARLIYKLFNNLVENPFIEVLI
jgi:hypothetical protein